VVVSVEKEIHMIQKSKKIGQGCFMALGVLFLILLVILIIDVSNDEDKPTTVAIGPTFTATAKAKVLLPTVTPLPPTQTPTDAPTAIPTPTRCLDAPEELIQAIETGLTVGGGGWLDAMTAQAVKSNDFNSVYFVAAAIYGPGMGQKGVIGVWATNNLTPGQGLIYAVDAVALEFSDWGDGRRTDAQMSVVSDGASEAADCVKQKQGV
jgi:hypothetical protein